MPSKYWISQNLSLAVNLITLSQLCRPSIFDELRFSFARELSEFSARNLALRKSGPMLPTTSAKRSGSGRITRDTWKKKKKKRKTLFPPIRPLPRENLASDRGETVPKRVHIYSSLYIIRLSKIELNSIFENFVNFVNAVSWSNVSTFHKQVAVKRAVKSSWNVNVE